MRWSLQTFHFSFECFRICRIYLLLLVVTILDGDSGCAPRETKLPPHDSRQVSNRFQSSVGVISTLTDVPGEHLVHKLHIFRSHWFLLHSPTRSKHVYPITFPFAGTFSLFSISRETGPQAGTDVVSAYDHVPLALTFTVLYLY